MTSAVPNQPPLRIGIAGCGPYSRLIARAYGEHPGVTVAAFCDFDASLAEEAAGETHGAAAFADYAQMIREANLDAVEILYGPAFHREVAEEACRRGKHIAVHKPLSLSLEDAHAIGRAVKRAGVVAMVADPLLFHPAIDEARNQIERHQIGAIESIRVKSCAGGFGGWGPGFSAEAFSSEFANPLILPAFDKVTLIESLMGPAREVFAYRAERSIVVSYRFEGVCRYGTHEVLYAPDLEVTSDGFSVDEAVEVTGTDGIVFLRNLSATMVEAPRLLVKRKDRARVWDDRRSFDFDRVVASMCAHFAGCACGRKAPAHTLDDAVRALVVNQAAMQSAAEARPVTL